MTTQILGNVFENYEEIDSTQTEIHRRIEKCKIQNGTIIMANRQTNGKGTHMVEFGIQVMKIILHFHFILKQSVSHKKLKE